MEQSTLAPIADRTRNWLGPAECSELLRRHGIPTPAQMIVATPEAAAEAAQRIGFPVALKAVAPGLLHKSEVGGVRVGLASADEVAEAARAMAAAIPALRGFVVQAMAPPGVELIVGLKRDPVFGPVVVVGLGGIWAELLHDTALRLAPVGATEAAAMLRELRGWPVLAGSRGAPPVDVEAAADLIARVSRLPDAEPALLELDLNPVIVSSQGLMAVDARVGVVQWQERPSGPPMLGGTHRTRWGHPASAVARRRSAAGTAEPVASPQDRGQLARGWASLSRLLSPRSIVVVGASADRGKQGGRLFHYLLKHGFPGSLYAVNPRAEPVMGRPGFPSVEALPEAPDLACIMVPAEAVPGVVEACGRRGIGAAIVYTSGFAETGEAGARRQAELVDVARRAGVRLCGPNTAGVVNVAGSTCAAFGMAFEVERMPPGGIAFLTQSGALGSSLLSRAWAQGIGFSHWVCSGNETDLTLADYLLCLVDDPETRVLAVFMESVADPARFAEACRLARARGKPIVVYKTGVSAVGQRAVRSHTALLAGDDAVYDAVFRKHGVVRVPDLQALVDAALAFAWQPLPRGPRVAVVSASGGACSVIADECARHGLELPALPAGTVERIREIIPPFGAAQNPIDVTIQITVNPDMVGRVASLLLAEPAVDAVIVLMTTNAGAPALEVAKGVVRATESATKPVLVVRVGAEFLAPESIAYYAAHHLPLYPMPDRAVKALKAMVEYSRQPSATRGRAGADG